MHDCLIIAGNAAPNPPYFLNYFDNLQELYGDSKVIAYSQNAKTHSKTRITSILRALSRAGARLGGLTGTKTILAERLASALQQIVEAGRTDPANEAMNIDGESDDGVEKCHPPIRERYYRPVATSYGDVPHGALVTAEQAESTLGHIEATEFDDADLEAPDKDLRAEEEALLGRHVNPEGIAYDCMCPPFEAADGSTWKNSAAYG